jgi:NTP pyrophosphatase (non-canonical NTP hydrolase)
MRCEHCMGFGVRNCYPCKPCGGSGKARPAPAVTGLDEYQTRAGVTRQPWQPIVYPAIGLAGEAGEVAEQVKRILRDDGGVLTEARRSKIRGELGDVLWYLAALAADCGFTLSEVANGNLEKIASCAARGVVHGEGDNR